MKIAFMADAHLGYASGQKTHAASGLNMRVRDGYLALRERVDQIIAAQVDLVIDGGDLFHKSWPTMADVAWARQELNRFIEAGIPVIGNTGNHDASNERGKAPATAVVHDPARGLDFITEPYRAVRPVEGLTVHAVSHYGLAQSERLIPEPVDGDINIFTTHGAAMVPGHEVFLCVDSPGEQAISLDVLLNPGYAVNLLGHYHGMGEVMANTWYAGSSLRRGFSDPEGGRGWLLVTVEPSGKVVVEPQYIRQRPQHDLPAIDAAGLTGAQVEEAIRDNLGAVDLGNAIVRQVVTNCSTATRQGIDQPALRTLTEPTLIWQPVFRRPEPGINIDTSTGEQTPGEAVEVSASLTTAGSADLPSMYADWVDEWTTATSVPTEIAPTVAREGDRHLRAVSIGVDSNEDHVEVPA